MKNHVNFSGPLILGILLACLANFLILTDSPARAAQEGIGGATSEKIDKGSTGKKDTAKDDPKPEKTENDTPGKEDSVKANGEQTESAKADSGRGDNDEKEAGVEEKRDVGGVPVNEADQAANPPDPEAEPVQREYPGVLNRHIQRGGDGTPSISLYYPVFNNAEVDAAMREFAESHASEFEKETAPEPVDAAEVEDETPPSRDMWEMTGFYSLTRPSPDIASVTFNIYSFSGGAHGNVLIRCLNYDLKTGKRLELGDLFRDKEKALQLLSEISASKLRKELGEDAEEDMIESGTSAEESNFANLSLNPEGLDVEFQPYEVGPWSIGPQTVAITLAEMRDAAPKASVWPLAATLGEEVKEAEKPGLSGESPATESEKD